MPLGSATITSKDGPAQTVTAQALSDVSRVDFQLLNSILQITQAPGGKIKEYDLAATTTITATISSGVMALTVSQ